MGQTQLLIQIFIICAELILNILLSLDNISKKTENTFLSTLSWEITFEKWDP